MSAVGALVLAHQGGWDEMLLVLGPIVAIVLLLRLARNRAAQAAAKAADESDPDGE
jgi:hypothetical protein